jgi:hypothetical protein
MIPAALSLKPLTVRRSPNINASKKNLKLFKLAYFPPLPPLPTTFNFCHAAPEATTTTTTNTTCDNFRQLSLTMSEKRDHFYDEKKKQYKYEHSDDDDDEYQWEKSSRTRHPRSSHHHRPQPKNASYTITKSQPTISQLRTMISSRALIDELKADLEKLRKPCTCVICQAPLFEPYFSQCGHVYCYGVSSANKWYVFLYPTYRSHYFSILCTKSHSGHTTEHRREEERG